MGWCKFIPHKQFMRENISFLILSSTVALTVVSMLGKKKKKKFKNESDRLQIWLDWAICDTKGRF